MKKILFILFVAPVIGFSQTTICDGDPISETTSGFFAGAGFQNLYVLVDNTTGNIVATNTTGTFTQADYGAGNIGNYSVYAINSDDASVIAEMSGNGSYSSAVTNANGTCTDIIGPQDYLIQDCTPTEVCDGDNIVQTTSGFFNGAGFQQLYVLVNLITGNIVATNSTGTFTQGDYGAGNIGDYIVYAVNTDDATVIAEVIGNGTWATAETNAGPLCADIIGPVFITIIECCDLDVVATPNAESCVSADDGSISLVINGTGTYDVFVDGSATPTFDDINASTQTISNLADGTYSINIFDISDATCDTTFSVTIIAGTAQTIPSFTQVSPICNGATLAVLPTTSTNGITGSWSPAINNTVTTTYTFTPSIGECATNTSMTINVNPTFNVTQSEDVCENTVFTYPDGTLATITTNESHTSNLTTGTSCDSIVITNVTMIPAVLNTVASTVCSGSSYTYADGVISNNITVNESHVSIMTSALGCDSVVTEDLTIGSSITNTEDYTICSGANFTYADGSISNNIAVNESHVSTLTAALGCDSLLTENVTILPAIVNTINNDVCNSQNYTYADGTTSSNITVNENHVSILVAVSGCDSLVTENLTIVPAILNTVSVDICSGGSYIYADGSTSLNITINENLVTTLTSISGCDSVVTENITVLPSYNSIDNINSCENSLYTYPDGTTTTISANESHTSNLITGTGCDSIIVTNVTMNPVYAITENTTICSGSNFTYPDGTVSSNITSAESHVSNLTTTAGCDSIITTNITIGTQFTSSTNFNICSGGNYTYADGTTTTNLTTNESHTSNFVTGTGCDSLVTENLIALPVYTIIEDLNICENITYTYHDGTTELITGNTSYTSNLVTGTGCDSIIVTNITMDPLFTVNETVNACENTNYTFPDGFTTLVTSNSTHSSVLTASTGCDSTIITTLTMSLVQANTVNNDLCSGSNFTYADGTNATNVIANETYISSLFTSSGCDSIVTENINILPSITNTLNTNICTGSNFTYADGTTALNITTSESHISTLVATTGCDSIVTENLNVVSAILNTISVELCEGGSHTYADGTIATNITANESHVSTLLSLSGCDSIITENINVSPTYNTTNDITICENEVVTYPDGVTETINSSTSHTSNLITSSGCDSVIVTNITMNPIFSVIENINACENASYIYPDGFSETITANTSHSSILTSSTGCDSTVVTNISSIPAFSNTVNNTACSGASYIYSDGITALNILTNQSHTSVLTSVNGCDSLITENISVLQPVTTTIDTTVCSGTDYTFADASNHVNILLDQTHTSTLTSVNGCDSIVVENVTVNSPLDVDLGLDLTVCSGELVGITAISNGSIPEWSTGNIVMNIDYIPTTDTFFVATVWMLCGTDTVWASDTLFINVFPSINVDAGISQTIPLGAEVQLGATGADSYTWSPSHLVDCFDCQDPIGAITQSTTFIVTGFDENGCSATDTVHITIDGEIEIFIPNVFSPNGDGENDLFKVYGTDWRTYKMQIYNRWGGLIFDSEDPNNEWDGTHYKNGEELPQAVFVYKFWGVSTVGLTFEKAGNVMLSR